MDEQERIGFSTMLETYTNLEMSVVSENGGRVLRKEQKRQRLIQLYKPLSIRITKKFAKYVDDFDLWLEELGQNIRF